MKICSLVMYALIYLVVCLPSRPTLGNYDPLKQNKNDSMERHRSFKALFFKTSDR